MQLSYDYTVDDRDYYRVIWKLLDMSSIHIYIPSGLDGKGKRSALASGLCMVRNKVREQRREKLEAKERERKFREEYPVITSLSDDEIVYFEPLSSGLYIMGGDAESCRQEVIDINVAEQLIEELQKMVSQIPRRKETDGR